MNWSSFDKKSPLEQYVLSKEVSYNKILNTVKENSNSNDIEIQELQNKVHNRDTYRVYKCFHDHHEFLGTYVSIYRRQNCSPEYLSERLESRGRIILDFDFEINTSLYNQIKNVFGIDIDFRSKGLEKFICNLICKAFLKIGCNKIAVELDKPVITWLSKGSYCDHLGFRDVKENIQAPPICFISDCREGKISYHILLPIYSEQRHIHTMYLIETMNMLLRNGDMGIQLGVNDSFSDMNMTKEHQCIRLPGMYKYKTMSKLVLLDNSHFPYCVTSSIYSPAFVPDIFRLGNIPYPSWIVQKNLNLKFGTIDDNHIELWEKICSYSHCKCITDHYEGIQLKNNKYTLIPKNKKGEHFCPVCNATHDHILPIINKRGNRIELGCYSLNHKSTKKSILIEELNCKNENILDKKEYINHTLTQWFGILHDVPNDILMDKYEDKICHSFPSPDTYKLLMVASPMGTGKTHQLRSYVSNYYNQLEDKILVISFRKTLGLELAKSIPSLCYYEDNQEWMYSDKVVTTIESFWKWQYLDKKGYTVIIDEWESALMEIIGNTVKDPQLVLSAFEIICKNAKNIIVMDAKLTWNTGGTFFELLGISRNEMYICWNTIKDNDIEEKKIIIHTDKDKFYTQLKNESNDTKIDVRTTIYASSIANKIRYMRGLQHDEIAIFTAKSTDKNIGVEDRYYQNGRIKVCITNQVDQAGVSFDREYYDVQYSYGNGMTSGFDGLLQMERRVRKHSRNQIYAYVQNWNQNYKMLDLDRYMHYLGEIEKEPYYRRTSEQRLLLSISYKYKLILARLYVKRALSKQYFEEGYKYMHEKVHGYKVEVDIDGVEKKEMMQEYKSAIADLENEKINIKNRFDIDIHMKELDLKQILTKLSTCNIQHTINELQKEELKIKDFIRELEIEKKESILYIKNKISEMKSDLKEYVSLYNEEKGIEIIPTPKLETPSWKKIIEEIIIEDTNDEKEDIKNVQNQLINLTIGDLHPDLHKVFISDSQELYYFNRCLIRCNRNLKWKQAGNLYYHLWCKNKKENIICASMMKDVIIDRDKQYNEYRQIGMSFIESMNKACPHTSRKEATLAMVRFDNLIDLLRLGIINKHDDTGITIIYKSGVCNNPEFKHLLFRIDTSSYCRFMNNKSELNKDVWKCMNMYFSEYCCISSTYKKTKHGGNECYQFDLDKELSLLNIEFLYTKIMEVKDET